MVDARRAPLKDQTDITGARAQEMYLPLWLRLYTTLKTPNINVQLVR